MDFFRRYRDKQRKKCENVKAYTQVRGGRDGKRTDIFMFKKKSGREKKTHTQNKEAKLKAEEKMVSYNTVLKK